MRLILFSNTSFLIALLLCVSGGPTAALGQGDADDFAVIARNCKLEFINKVDVPAKADGPLTDMMFEEGDTVTEGQVMATIDATAARYAVELKKAEKKEAELEAKNDVAMRDAKNSAAVAAAEYAASSNLGKDGVVPFWDLEKQRLEAERGELRIEMAEKEKTVALIQMFAKDSELELAKLEVEKRKVTAPVTGYIQRRIAQKGQWVQQGAPVATVIQMDRLRVKGDIDSLAYPGLVEIGAPADVTVFHGGQSTTMKGTIGFVSMEVDVANETLIWVEIENERFGNDWKFKPGMTAQIKISKPGS